MQILKSCEANKACVPLTYKVLLKLSPLINEYFDISNNT